MEKSYGQYILDIAEVITQEYIREAAAAVKPLGKFRFTGVGWEPDLYRGYTLITPEGREDTENQRLFGILSTVKGNLYERLDPHKALEAPDSALHMTVARLVSGEVFENRLKGPGEVEFLEAMRGLFNRKKGLGEIKFQVTGISVFSGIVAAMVAPADEEGYGRLQELRDSIYSDHWLKLFGVERKRGFTGHITLLYLEDTLTGQEGQLLAETVIRLNAEYFDRPKPFNIIRAEVRKFDNYLDFYRKDGWPVLELI